VLPKRVKSSSRPRSARHLLFIRLGSPETVAAMSLLSALSPKEKNILLKDIYYLNMQELRAFCDAREIPYSIYYETEDRRIKRSRDQDRKAIVLDRIVHYLETGTIKPRTIFKKAVVASDTSTESPQANDNVFYGRYKNGDIRILKLMKRLTAGRFEFGAIAQEVLRDFWSSGKAPTYAKFAKAWMRAAAKHDKPNREWAFLADLAAGSAGPDWKKMRKKKAGAVVALLNKIA
jgi:hypothetical protein